MPYFEYYYSFPFGDESMELVTDAMGVLSSVGSLLGLVCYVLGAISLYTIANRRGLKNPWLAWLPVGFEWLLGSVSDQYQYLVKDRDTSRRKLMLGFSIASFCTGFVVIVVAVVLLVKLAFSAAMMSEAQIAEMILWPVMTAAITSLIMAIVALVLMVLRCVCLYDLYRSCQPDNATLYLVLGILFGFLEPVFLMIVRNKDEGMPPRKPEPVYKPQEYEMGE